MKKNNNAERQKRFRERKKIADLSQATAATINEIRLAFEIQATESEIELKKRYATELKKILGVQGVKK